MVTMIGSKVSPSGIFNFIHWGDAVAIARLKVVYGFFAALAVLLSVVAVFWTAFSSSNPWIFSDERYYSWLIKYAGDMLEAERVGLVSTIPKFFLYYWVYGFSFGYKVDPYVLNKALNVVFWILSGCSAYVASLRFFKSNIYRTLVVAVVVWSPLLIYTRMYTPEVMYYAGFWLCVAVIVWLWSPSKPQFDFIIGVFLGALSLVKSHAVFLVPGFAFGIILGRIVFFGRSSLGWKKSALGLAFLLVGWTLCKYVLGVTLPGSGSWGIVSGGYGSEFGRMVSLVFNSGEMRSLVFEVLARHIGVAVFSGGVAFYMAFVVASKGGATVFCGGREGSVDGAREVVVAVASLSVLITLVLVTAVFTVSSVGVDRVYESVDRTHTRYYGYAISFVIFAGAVAANSSSWVGFASVRPKVFSGFAVFVMAACSLLVMPKYLNANDGPDALILSVDNIKYVFFAAILVACVLMVKVRSGFLTPVVLVWGVLYGSASFYIYQKYYYEITSVDQPGDVIGRALRFYVKEADRDSGFVYARSVDIDLYRTLFYLNSRAPVKVGGSGAGYMDLARSEGKKWVVRYGYSFDEKSGAGCSHRMGDGVWLYWVDVGACGEYESKIEGGAQTEVRALGLESLILRNGNVPEPWGVWLRHDSFYELKDKFSGDVEIDFVLHGLGRNVGRNVVISLGESKASITLAATPTLHRVRFKDVRGAKYLKFSGLVPESPSRLGMGQDDRDLAMGVSSLVLR